MASGNRSGKKKNVVISCVTFETAKVIEPIIHYDADRVHLLHYGTDNIYAEFHDHVEKELRTFNDDMTIVDHSSSKVYNFTEMLRETLSIIEEEQRDPDVEIFINISAGTSEYSAAAMIASMMSRDVKAFTVGTKEYMVEGEMVRKVFFDGDKPVGMTKTTKTPTMLPQYRVETPPRHLIYGLKVLSERIDKNKPRKAKNMVEALKDQGLWYQDMQIDNMKEYRVERTEAVYYNRNFVSKWVEKGWIRKNELSKKYELTEDGELILRTFCLDSP